MAQGAHLDHLVDQSRSLTVIRADDPHGYGALPVTLSRWRKDGPTGPSRVSRYTLWSNDGKSGLQIGRKRAVERLKHGPRWYGSPCPRGGGSCWVIISGKHSAVRRSKIFLRPGTGLGIS